MFSLGIVSREQLPDTLHRSDRLPELSLTMLAEFDEELSQRDEAAIEAITCLELNRTTHRHRHSALDDVIAEEIDRNFSPSVTVRIHDTAVSNAITSVDLFDKIKSRPKVTLHASDLMVEYLVIAIPGKRWRVVFDSMKRPLQFVSRRMVIPASRQARRSYPINRLIRLYLRSRVLPEARRQLALAEASASNNFERIGAFHPRAVALAQRDPRFSLGQADLDVPLPGAFEIVRAMNIFFWETPKQVEQGLQGICAPLVEDGLLVIGQNRSTTGENLTTIFKRQGRNLIPLRDFGGGATVRETALGIRLAQDAISP